MRVACVWEEEECIQSANELVFQLARMMRECRLGEREREREREREGMPGVTVSFCPTKDVPPSLPPSLLPDSSVFLNSLTHADAGCAKSCSAGRAASKDVDARRILLDMTTQSRLRENSRKSIP